MAQVIHHNAVNALALEIKYDYKSELMLCPHENCDINSKDLTGKNNRGKPCQLIK